MANDRVDDRTIGDYIRSLAGEQAMPGGGSAAGIVAGFAAALGEMMGSLTRERSDLLTSAMITLAKLRQEALDCARADEVAYGGYLSALLLPKTTPEDKASRKAAMATALETSARVPLKLAQVAVGIVDAVEHVILDGNKTVMGDAESAIVLALATMDICRINVRSNLPYLKDPVLVNEIQQSIETAYIDINRLAAVRRAQIANRQ